MPLTDATKKYFTRYSKFYLQNDSVCWRVEATDWISTPGILEITAVEYYANETEDDVEKGLVGSLVVKDVNINPAEIEAAIVGETFITPKRKYHYYYDGIYADGTWNLDNKLPIVYKINDDNSIDLKWTASYSG